MANKTKIVLEQHGTLGPVKAGGLKYTVASLTNRTRPMVGEVLTEDDVNKLKTETVGLTIEIKPAKNKR